jgi:hypothetical protein
VSLYDSNKGNLVTKPLTKARLMASAGKAMIDKTHPCYVARQNHKGKS